MQADVTIVTTMDSMAAVDRLAFSRRGDRLECHIQQQNQKQRHKQSARSTSVRLVYRLPLSEILVDFTDKLLSATSGEATFDVQESGEASQNIIFLAARSNASVEQVLSLMRH